MYCKKCGTQMEDDMKFCKGCGTPVNEETNESKLKPFAEPEIKSSGKSVFTKIISGIVGVVVVIFLISAFSSSGENNKMVESVKNSSPNNYPNVLVGEAFEEFFSSPKWKGFESEKGQKVVEFTGGCLYDEIEVEACIQFVINEDEEGSSVEYVSFNDVTQSDIIIWALLDKVYDEYESDKIK